MQKYKPITVFVTTHQADALHVLAQATRDPKNNTVKDESRSSLVRQALTQFFTNIEEYTDAAYYPAIAPGFGARGEQQVVTATNDPRN